MEELNSKYLNKSYKKSNNQLHNILVKTPIKIFKFIKDLKLKPKFHVSLNY